MHVEKNVCDSLLNTILGMGKSKNTDNARKDLVDMKIRLELHVFTQGDKMMKPATNFTSNLTKNITDNDNKIVGLKSHDHHVIMHHLLLLGIRPFPKKTIVTTIYELYTFLK